MAIAATHPIQYQVPMYRLLSADPEVDLHVFYASDHSVRGGVDPGFGISVAWDIPMLEGYRYTLLKHLALPLRPRSVFEYNCPSLRWRLAAGKYDAVLVYGYGNVFYWQAITSAWALRIPLLVRPEGNDACRPRGWLKTTVRRHVLSRLYQRVSAYLAIGTRSREHFMRHGGDESRLFWSPYCVDNSFFRRRAENAREGTATRQELGLSHCNSVAVFCGKLTPKKAPLVLAEALALMRHKDKFGLIVVGDGELRRQMERAVAASGIAANAFVGFRNQTELPKFYKAADFTVLPSSWGETWGLVVNEAMNFGLPAIVSDRVGCAPDLIEEGVTGYTFPAGNAKVLAQKIDLLVSEPEKRSAMGQRAKEKVGEYSVEAACAGIKRALVDVARERGME